MKYQRSHYTEYYPKKTMKNKAMPRLEGCARKTLCDIKPWDGLRLFEHAIRANRTESFCAFAAVCIYIYFFIRFAFPNSSLSGFFFFYMFAHRDLNCISRTRMKRLNYCVKSRTKHFAFPICLLQSTPLRIFIVYEYKS